MKGLGLWRGLVAMCISCCAAAAADTRSVLLGAQRQFERGHYEKALKLYKPADAAAAGHPAVKYNIGLCHLNLDDADKAIQHFEGVASQTEANRPSLHMPANMATCGDMSRDLNASRVFWG